MTRPLPPSRRRFLLQAAGTTAVVLGGGSVLAACGDDGDAPAVTGDRPSTTAAGESTTTTAVEVAQVTAMMPFTVSLGYALELWAKTGGHFEAESLEVDVQFARGAGQALQALLAGQVHIARVGVLNLVPAVANEGAPAIGVAMPTQTMLYRLVSSTERPIETLADLEGRTVGLPSLAGNAEETLNLVLQEADIDPASVGREAVGFDAAAYGFVEQGRVDALFTNVDIAAILESQGASIVIADVDETNPLLGTMMASTTDWAEQNGDVLVRYFRALGKAREELEDEAKIDEIIPALAAEWDIAVLAQPDLAKAVLADQAELWNGAGEEEFLRNVPERWESGLEGFARVGAVPADLDPAAFYDNQFVDEALSS